MIHATRIAKPRLSLNPRLSPVSPTQKCVPQHHLQYFMESRNNQKQADAEHALVSHIKLCTTHFSIHHGVQIHTLVLKTGLLDSNIFIRNSLVNLYVKCGFNDQARRMFDSCLNPDIASWNTMIGCYVKLGRLKDAQSLFDEMPERDCVSFTTMIMGLAKNGDWIESLEVFKQMKFNRVQPSEVTLASLLSAYSSLGGKFSGSMLHGIVIKNGLASFVLVSTNLIKMYCNSSSIDDAAAIFDEMPERNEVSWNVMLNGYSKMGLVDSARDLFDRMPVGDLISWSTMIHGYIRSNRLDEALEMYRRMVSVGMVPNEVLMVDLVSACGDTMAIDEGWQLHGMVMKTGLECFVFMQATIIHFYAACSRMDLACLQFELGCKDNISSWNALIGGFVGNHLVDLARQVFDEMPERDVISWSSMIAGYAQTGQSDSALQLFREMLASGEEPNEITMVSVLSCIAKSGNLHQGKWIHSYINDNLIPLNDNLSAALIDMYAKCGSINNALEVFNRVHDKISSVSPWNTIICGMAMHGHVDMSLRLFSYLQQTHITPNSITFIGVLSACCHAGLLQQGKWYFDCMKKVYGIEPNIKHYGCMVDLLGRTGYLEEAEILIKRMPVRADVVIWGTLLAASKTHDNMEVGERAARNLAQLEPAHGAGRVLISNMYADAGRWDEVLLTRRVMQSQRMKKNPGCSDVV